MTSLQVIKQGNKVVALKRWSSGQLPLYYSQGICIVFWWNRLRLSFTIYNLWVSTKHGPPFWTPIRRPFGLLLDPYLDAHLFFAAKLDLYANEVYLISEAKCKEWMNSHFCWKNHCIVISLWKYHWPIFSSFTLKRRIINWLLPFVIGLIVAKHCVFLSIL